MIIKYYQQLNTAVLKRKSFHTKLEGKGSYFNYGRNSKSLGPEIRNYVRKFLFAIQLFKQTVLTARSEAPNTEHGSTGNTIISISN